MTISKELGWFWKHLTQRLCAFRCLKRLQVWSLLSDSNILVRNYLLLRKYVTLEGAVSHNVLYHQQASVTRYQVSLLCLHLFLTYQPLVSSTFKPHTKKNPVKTNRLANYLLTLLSWEVPSNKRKSPLSIITTVTMVIIPVMSLRLKLHGLHVWWLSQSMNKTINFFSTQQSWEWGWLQISVRGEYTPFKPYTITQLACQCTDYAVAIKSGLSIATGDGSNLLVELVYISYSIQR